MNRVAVHDRESVAYIGVFVHCARVMYSFRDMQFSFRGNSRSNRKQPLGKMGRVIFVIVGLGMCIGGSFLTMEKYKLTQVGVNAPGKIVDQVRKEDRDSDDGRITVMYTPVVGFTAKDGKEYTFTGSVSSNIAPQIGKSVTVLYDEKDPKKASINSFVYIWVGPLAVLFMGVVFLYFGIFSKAKAGPVVPSMGEVSAEIASQKILSMVGSKISGNIPVPSQPGLPPIPSELVIYVQSSRAQGVENSVIRQTLVTSGWSADLVDRALV